MARSYTEFDDLTSIILKCAFEVHTVLGPGLLESTYKETWLINLKNRVYTFKKKRQFQ
jgi:GxxExxY protein